MAKLLKVLLFPDDTVNEEELLAEFIPNVDAVWPISTLPDPTVEPGVILVTVLKTDVPETETPLAPPVMFSVMALPAISVPTTVKTVLDWSPPPSVSILIVPPKTLWEIGVPSDVLADMLLPENKESVSLAVPFVIQAPKSIVIAPVPVVEEREEKPGNSRVWEVASWVTRTSELNAFAIDGSWIESVAVVLPLDVLSLVLLANDDTLVLRLLNSSATSAIVEISKFLLSIFFCIASLSGVVSALTKLSTIWVTFRPDPFEFIALK